MVFLLQTRKGKEMANSVNYFLADSLLNSYLLRSYYELATGGAREGVGSLGRRRNSPQRSPEAGKAHRGHLLKEISQPTGDSTCF